MAQLTASDPPLVFGFAVGTAEPRELTWSELETSSAGSLQERRWIHLNRNSPEAKAWLQRETSVETIVANALFQEDSRPRAFRHGSGLLINLRGVNMNEGESVEDMVSFRLWVTDSLIVSTQARTILAAEDLKTAFEVGKPPAGNGAIIAFLANRLTHRLEDVVDTLVEEADTLEELSLDPATPLPKLRLTGFRRKALHIRRYVSPQREALAGILRDHEGLLTDRDALSLRETQDVVTRIAEELDTVRERALVLQEQIVEQRAEAMNQRLFVLAIFSAIFLPLGFVTGLFGVNVGGMPGVDSALAFSLLCLALSLLAGILLFVFRRVRWL